uniref:Uncharacterized protein n=1 Tax=Knipowitschia caucasica TaxID=637954 RepID=A0AAV2JDC3_KNICA
MQHYPRAAAEVKLNSCDSVAIGHPACSWALPKPLLLMLPPHQASATVSAPGYLSPVCPDMLPDSEA